MALILGIETSTSVCSVALTDGERILSLRESASANEHSAMLTNYLEDVMRDAGKNFDELDAIAVSIGPGSYTGLRIGVSSAKGLCYALNKPLIAIDTLQAIAWQALLGIDKANDNLLLCPMIDARRMEVYTALYSTGLEIISPVEATIVDEFFYNRYKNYTIYLMGNGAEKCRDILKSRSDIYFSDIDKTSAIGICALAQTKFKQNEFADIAYCEPFYFKDFIAGKPKVKGLYE